MKMPYIVTIQAGIHDPEAVRGACRRLGLEPPQHGSVSLCGGEVTGLAVKPLGWVYPAAIDLATGEIRYDNFGGRWGAREHLDAFLSECAIEQAPITARSAASPSRPLSGPSTSGWSGKERPDVTGSWVLLPSASC